MLTVEGVLGTRAEVEATSSTAARASAAEAERAVIAEAQRLEAIFTVFDESSAMHSYRRNGATDVPELLEVLELATHWQRRSNALFDPRLRAAMQVWDRAEAAGVAPTQTELDNALAERNNAPFNDVNAIAKGWIADRCAQCAFDTPGIERVWLSLGGDLVHRGTASIRIGIEDPLRPYDNVAPTMFVQISNEALATSGGARRWWTIDGRRYAKVLDPRTGRPVDHVAGASVLATDAATADVLATIANVATIDETFALAAAVDAHCLVIDRDGARHASSARFELS